jgi:hypothetical protein
VDIKAGEPHLLYLGLPSTEAGCLDPETGLPLGSIGCVYSEQAAALMDGYSHETLRALHTGELAPFVLKYELTSRVAVEARVHAEGGFTLAVGSPAADSPNGRYRIEVAPRFGNPDDTPYVFSTNVATGKRQELWFIREKARVLFDHDDTTLLVRDEGYKRYFTVDLPRQLQLQFFPDPDRGW